MKMKKIYSFLAILLLLFCTSTEYTVYAATSKKITDIDTNMTYQTIEGFGASYTWYADWVANNNKRETAYDWIFNDTEFNILRFRDQHGIKGDEKNIPIEGYKTYKSYYDAAVARGIDPIVLVTSWGEYDRSLPFVAFNELSENGYTYYTLAKDENGEYMYDELAAFCVQSIQYFLDAGIPVHYFSISNEIELQELHKDENGNARKEAGFFIGKEETEDYCAYWKAHVAVYEAFQKAFGDKAPSIIGAETMAGSPNLLKGYLEPLMEENSDKFDVVAHHLYGTTLTEINFRLIQKYFSDYRLWQTEWYTNEYLNLGDIILSELINENITAFLYWNGVWVQDENCLIGVSSWEPNAELKLMPGHYIMMHFSKFIKNGYQRVDVQEKLSTKVGAFLSPDNSELVVIASNYYGLEENLYLNINREIKSSEVYRSNGLTGTYMEAIGEYEEGMSLPSKTLTTIVLELGDEIEPESEVPEEVIQKEETQAENFPKSEASEESSEEEANVTEINESEKNTEISVPETTDNQEDSYIFIIAGVVLAVTLIAVVSVLCRKKLKK